MKSRIALIISLAVVACMPAAPIFASSILIAPAEEAKPTSTKPDPTKKLATGPSKACLNSVAVLKARSARLQGQLTERQKREATRMKTWQGLINDVESKSPRTGAVDKSLAKFKADITSYSDKKADFFDEYKAQINASVAMANDTRLTCDKANRTHLAKNIAEVRVAKDKLSKSRTVVANEISKVNAGRKQLLKDRLACTKAKKCKKAKVIYSPTDSPAGKLRQE